MANIYYITTCNGLYKAPNGYTAQSSEAKQYPTFEHARNARCKGEQIKRGL